MKIAFVTIGFFFVSLAVLLMARQMPEENPCKFTVSESMHKAAVGGPNEIVRLVHVADQPDSPLEILAIDFQDSSLVPDGDTHGGLMRFKVRLRNRSDKLIRGLSVLAWSSRGTGGAGIAVLGLPEHKPGLSPDEEVELQTPAGSGSRGKTQGDLRFVVNVEWVGFEGCQYYPSVQLPFKNGDNTRYHWRSLWHP